MTKNGYEQQQLMPFCLPVQQAVGSAFPGKLYVYDPRFGGFDKSTRQPTTTTATGFFFLPTVASAFMWLPGHSPAKKLNVYGGKRLYHNFCREQFCRLRDTWNCTQSFGPLKLIHPMPQFHRCIIASSKKSMWASNCNMKLWWWG